MKLPRTIRLDPSDCIVFEHAAEPGEWAVPGSFMFWDADVETLAGKARAAFRSGFVGVVSLGFATLVAVAEASEAERERAVEALARHFVARFGAPDIATARAAARAELDFAASLCGHPVGTVIAMHRRLDGSGIREQFRTLQPRETDSLHARSRAFTFVEVEEEPEHVDLLGLLETKRP